jgi:Ankyrin repeats (3 copies)
MIYCTRAVQHINISFGLSGPSCHVTSPWHTASGYVRNTLIEAGCNVRARDDKGRTALHLAIETDFKDSEELCKELLKHPAVDLNATDSLDRTPLLYSVKRMKTGLTKLLLDHGAKANTVNVNDKRVNSSIIYHSEKTLYEANAVHLVREALGIPDQFIPFCASKGINTRKRLEKQKYWSGYEEMVDDGKTRTLGPLAAKTREKFDAYRKLW